MAPSTRLLKKLPLKPPGLPHTSVIQENSGNFQIIENLREF